MTIEELRLIIKKANDKKNNELKKVGTKTILELFEKEIDNYNFEDLSKNSNIKDIMYVLRVTLSKNNDSDKDKIYLLIQDIHTKIKNKLIEKPGHINKTNQNYKTLKKIINDLEAVTLSYLYDYIDDCNNETYNFINLLVFEIKNLPLIEDAIEKFPYITNIKDENDNYILEKIIYNYLTVLTGYTNLKELSSNADLIYYDKIIDLFINSKEFNKLQLHSPKLKQIEKYLSSLKKEEYTEQTKRKFIFWINNLKEKLFTENILSEEKTIKKIKYKYDIDDDFEEDILSEVRLTKKCMSKKCLDGRIIIPQEECILTIDGENAEEIDDGLSVIKLINGNYLLKVHIADPVGLVKNNSIIYDEALKRTTSIYLSDGVIPQFPKELTKEFLSLKSRSYRLARTYEIELTNNSEIVSYNVKKTAIFVTKKMSYKQFNQMLEKPTGDIVLDDTINKLEQVSNILAKLVKIDDIYYQVTRNEKNTTSTNIIGKTSAEKLVERTMILTNHLTAKYFYDNKLPFIYRNHQEDPILQEKIESFKLKMDEDPENIEIRNIIETYQKMYPRSYYDTKCLGHFGLNLDTYSHVTSPLRRSADIVANVCMDEIIDKKVEDKKIYALEDFLKEQCNYINARRINVESFSNEYEKIKILKK
ncbi:MAG: ribonuclease catalytic domain-containing protein [Bacilli bacterium]|nr:ribonuclease catalytic domain-containing protein [Bacilli bacterium]